MQITTVANKPTTDMPEGLYRVIRDGIYCGAFRVSVTWTGAVTVQPAWGDDLVAVHNAK